MLVRRRAKATCPLLIAGALAGLAALAPAPADATPLPRPDAPFSYIVVRQDVPAYLTEFARWAGVFLQVDRDVQGVVEGPFDASGLAPDALLDRLAAEHGLFWWFDGAVLHVGPADAIETATVPLPPEGPGAAEETLDRLGLRDPRFPLRIDDTLGFAAVTGPAPYVARVSEALGAAAAARHAGRGGRLLVVRAGRPQETPVPPAWR